MVSKESGERVVAPLVRITDCVKILTVLVPEKYLVVTPSLEVMRGREQTSQQ
jgi:hypothetical protein